MLAVLLNWGTGIVRKIFLWLRNDNFLLSKNKLCMHNPYNKIILKQKVIQKKKSTMISEFCIQPKITHTFQNKEVTQTFIP